MERLRVGDSEIEYGDQGDGEPVVLVHAGFFSDWFVPVAARAELADVRVVRVRRAGYVAGAAPPRHLSLADHADHLDALLDTLNVERAHIVGHSSGALIALQLAAARPERVASLVLVEPARAGDSWPADDATCRFMATFADLAVRDLHATFVQAMETLCAPDYAQVITDALGPGALDRAERESVFQFADEGAAILEWCFDAATASRITQPVLLLQCVPMYGPIMADLVAWLPQATLTQLDGTDHMLPLRNPAALAALIAAFVRQHRTRRLFDQI